MRATVMYKAGEVRIANVPDARIINPTDALVKVTRACICGSDLWPYKKMEPSDTGVVMGHEAIGVVEDVGKDVRRVRRGDFVIMPFAWSDGTCEFCAKGLQTSCVHGGFFGNDGQMRLRQLLAAPVIRLQLVRPRAYCLAVEFALDPKWHGNGWLRGAAPHGHRADQGHFRAVINNLLDVLAQKPLRQVEGAA